MMAGPSYDPDYRSAWPSTSSVRGVTTQGDTITVDVAPGPVAPADPQLAVQQLVHTATAVAATRSQNQLVKVSLRVDGAPARTLWGLNVGSPILRAPPADILAPVWLSSPQEGDIVGGSFDVQIVGIVPGGAAVLRAVDASGTVVVDRSVALSAASPHQGEVHVTITLAPGRYRLEALFLDGNVTAALDDHMITVRAATASASG
jgi:hypothetical protein